MNNYTILRQSQVISAVSKKGGLGAQLVRATDGLHGFWFRFPSSITTHAESSVFKASRLQNMVQFRFKVNKLFSRKGHYTMYTG